MPNRDNTSPLQTFFEFAQSRTPSCHPIIRKKMKKVAFFKKNIYLCIIIKYY